LHRFYRSGFFPAENEKEGLNTEIEEEERLSEDSLSDMGNRLHVTMLKMTILFGLGFGAMNYFIGTRMEIYLSLSLVPVGVFFLWVYNLGYRVISKILALIFIVAIISSVSMVVSPDVLSPIFLIPIVTGTLIIFPGKEQKIGYVLGFGVFILLITLLMGDFQIGEPLPRTAEKIFLDKVTNILGVAVMCLLEIYYVMRVSQTIQKQLAERGENLRQSNKRLTSLVHSRESMVSILSHDLRSPLTLIVSTLDLLKPGRFPPDQLEGLVEKVSNRTKNTLLMLDSLLLWSKSQSDMEGIVKERVFLKEISLNLLAYCELLSVEKKVNYEISLPESGELMANRVMLDTIFRNLVSNAFKFTHKDGLIRVQGNVSGEFWQFEVEDNGRGMKPEILQNLRNGISFSTEGTNKEKGHGLGIQIVRDFLMKLGGSVEVESVEGKGTKFSFRLPV
jgi:signal transduction histidine kinase